MQRYVSNGAKLKCSTLAAAVALSAFLVFGGCGGDKPGKSGAENGGAGNALAEPADTQMFDTRWYTANPKAESFTISTAKELAGLAVLVNSEQTKFEEQTITLTADIDLSAYGKGSKFNGGKGWVPIGINGIGEQTFNGTFDGNGKKVRGLYINDTSLASAGLFGFIRWEGHILNLGVTDVDVIGKDEVGGVVGYAHAQAGGVTNCYSTGTVSGKNCVGGVAGSLYKAEVSRSYSSCTVNGENYVGGVTGCGGSTDSSYSTGNVSGKEYVGGVVGIGVLAEMCYSTGAVSGEKSVGGVMGRGDARNCYSTGAVSGINSVGGVVGDITNSGSVTNSYSTGTVSGTDGVGGIAGSFDIDEYFEESSDEDDRNEIANCAALNSRVSGGKNVGRVIGRISRNVITLSNNAAYTGLMDRGDKTHRWTVKGADNGDGADITTAELAGDGTLGGRFKSENGWTTAPGKLPGLRGAAVGMPEHLK